MRRGSRVVEIEIVLEPDFLPGGDPWESYYSSRLAWSNEAASIYRDVNQVVVPTETAAAQIAGYGVKLFFVLQSLEPLKAVYKDNWETFLANSG